MSNRLILGVDGGGSKTTAVIASLDDTGNLQVLGRGRGGPCNLKLAGKEQSLRSLDEAIDAYGFSFRCFPEPFNPFF